MCLGFIFQFVYGCTNFVGQSSVTVSSYSDLVDAISCDCTYITIDSSFDVTSEIIISNKNLYLIGTNGATISSINSRVFSIQDSSNVTISEISLLGGVLANGNGACISLVSSKLSLQNSNLRNGSALNGGSIYSIDSSLSMDSVTFQYNTASSNGGAIFCQNSASTVKIINSYIMNNEADVGGSIFAQNCDMDWASTLIADNGAYTSAGCIFAAYSDLLLDHSNITRCKILSNLLLGDNDSRGGFAVVAFSSVSFLYSTVSYCSAVWGSVMYATNSDIIVKHSHIELNTALYSAMYVGGTYASLSVTSSVMNDNFAVLDTSMLYCTLRASCFVGDSEFYRNMANNNGGITVVNYAVLEVKSSLFWENSASGSGAVLHVDYISDASFVNCSFIGNTVRLYGGVISASFKSTLSITNATFTNNSASSGGVLYSDFGVSVTIDSSHFSKNSASDGGCLSSYSLSKINIYNCEFMYNNAVFGGVLYLYSGVTVTIDDSELTHNAAEFAGMYA